PGPAGAELPGHAVLLAGRPDAACGRRDGPQPARQQQRLLPGRRGVLGRLGGGVEAAGPDRIPLPAAGRQMTDNDWQTGYARSLTVFLNGEAITEPGPRGDTVRDDSFLLLFN